MNNIEVVTRCTKNPDAPPQRMVIEDKNSFHWSWLNRHMTWSLRTGHSIALYPTDAAVTFVDRRMPGMS